MKELIQEWELRAWNEKPENVTHADIVRMICWINDHWNKNQDAARAAIAKAEAEAIK